MFMTGNLFRGTQSPVGEMGGNVLVGGPNYLGSGIFAGRARQRCSAEERRLNASTPAQR